MNQLIKTGPALGDLHRAHCENACYVKSGAKGERDCRPTAIGIELHSFTKRCLSYGPFYIKLI